MSPTRLGRELLSQMMSPAGRVVIVNRSTLDHNLVIVAMVIARHNTGGPTLQALINLDLVADESEWVDPPAPMMEPPLMIEVLLQLSMNAQSAEACVSAARRTRRRSTVGRWVSAR